jgi:hypothetical protein
MAQMAEKWNNKKKQKARRFPLGLLSLFAAIRFLSFPVQAGVQGWRKRAPGIPSATNPSRRNCGSPCGKFRVAQEWGIHPIALSIPPEQGTFDRRGPSRTRFPKRAVNETAPNEPRKEILC